MSRDRHARHRRVDSDPRRRPRAGLRISPTRFARIARDAVADLPAGLRPYLERTALRFGEIPPSRGETVLLAVRDDAGGACVVTLFRMPILTRAADVAEIGEIVREVVVEEVADHFGIDDATLDDLGW